MAAYDAAVAQAEAVVEADYTAATYAALQTALEENVVTEDNTQAEVDAATAAINAAIDALVEVADMAAYDAAVAQAEAVVEADYTAATYAALQTALEENVVTEDNTQEEVDAATAAINAAYDALVKILKVESVSAINGRQIQVVYNSPVDTTTGVYAGSYYFQVNTDANYATLATKDGTATVALDSTKKVATITFTTSINSNLSTTAGTPFNMKIAGVKDAVGNTLTPDYETQLIANDTTAPTLSSVSGAAKNTTSVLSLKFSEPVQTTGAIVYVDGQAATIQAGSTVNELKATAAQSLSAGSTYGVTVLNVVDSAGNFIDPNPTTTSVTISSDTEAPTVSSVVVKSDRLIQVTFSKPVDVTTCSGSINLVNTAGTAYAGNAGIVCTNPISTNLAVVDVTLPLASVLTFNSSNVYAGTIYFSGNITDLYGNSLVATSQAISITRDVTKPTVASVKHLVPGTVYTNSTTYANGAIVVKFSENVATNAGTITLLNSSGVNQAVIGGVAANTADATEVIISLTGTLGADTYTVITPNGLAKDITFAQNLNTGSTNTVSVSSSGDTTKPVIAAAPISGSTPATSLVSGTQLDVDITDNIAVDLNSAMNVNNYLLNGLPLPAGSYITNTVTGGTAPSAVTAVTANIFIPAGSIAKDAATYVLNVVNIKDLNGNVANPVAYTALTLNDDIAPTLTTGLLAANGTILLGFSEDVIPAATANLADFDLTMNGITVNAAANSAGNPVATIAQGVGSDAGKYVVTVKGYVDNGADGDPLTTADNRLFVDVSDDQTYDIGVDILVKTGVTSTPGSYYDVDANALANITVATIAAPSVVKDLSASAGPWDLIGGKTIIVK
jgi:methionine-rich copper-binding protein CopC